MFQCHGESGIRTHQHIQPRPKFKVGVFKHGEIAEVRAF